MNKIIPFPPRRIDKQIARIPPLTPGPGNILATVVDNGCLGEPEDLRVEIAGLRLAREILESKPLSAHINAELPPGPDADDDAALAELCRRTVETNWHPVGTCRMGPESDPLTVLDERLRVRGIDGLRVIDPSAMPFIPSGNTDAPTMALADRAVALMD